MSGGCVEGAVYDLAQDVLGGEPPVLQTLRLQRHGRVRGRADLRRLGRRLRPGGRPPPTTRSSARCSPSIEADAAGRAGHGDRRAAARSAPGWRSGRTGSAARSGVEGLDAAVTDDARGMLAQGATGQRHYGPARRAPPGRGHRVRRGVRAAAADAGLRRDRLRRRGGPDRHVPRLPGDRLRRARRSSPPRAASRTPTRWSSSGRTATWPATQVDERTVICVLTHDPKFDVPLLEVALRTPAWYVGAMGSRRTHDDRLAPAARGRADRGRAGPAALADRARPRRPHAGGDRGVDRGGDRRRPLGRQRAAARRRPRAPSTGPRASGMTPAPSSDPADGVEPRDRATATGDRRDGGAGGRVAGLVLAAGGGSRYGLAQGAGPAARRLLVERAGRLLAAGGCDAGAGRARRRRRRGAGAARLPRTVRQPGLADRDGLVAAGRAGRRAGRGRTRSWSRWSTPRCSARRRCAGWSPPGGPARRPRRRPTPGPAGHPVLLARTVLAEVAGSPRPATAVPARGWRPTPTGYGSSRATAPATRGTSTCRMISPGCRRRRSELCSSTTSSPCRCRPRRPGRCCWTSTGSRRACRGRPITKVDGDDFEGTVKVKVGPITVTYGGSGQLPGEGRVAAASR